jgi:sorbitol-specific phosphotransferase system component IIA
MTQVKDALELVISKLEASNVSETENNLQIGDTVMYNNKYYTIKAIGAVTMLENEETKELETVSNLKDIKKEIIDCNPVKLKIKPSFIGI